jgi:hypothetical protein
MYTQETSRLPPFFPHKLKHFILRTRGETTRKVYFAVPINNKPQTVQTANRGPYPKTKFSYIFKNSMHSPKGPSPNDTLYPSVSRSTAFTNRINMGTDPRGKYTIDECKTPLEKSKSTIKINDLIRFTKLSRNKSHKSLIKLSTKQYMDSKIDMHFNSSQLTLFPYLSIRLNRTC